MERLITSLSLYFVCLFVSPKKSTRSACIYKGAVQYTNIYIYLTHRTQETREEPYSNEELQGHRMRIIYELREEGVDSGVRRKNRRTGENQCVRKKGT